LLGDNILSVTVRQATGGCPCAKYQAMKTYPVLH